MNFMEEKIKTEGRVLSDSVIRVGSFLNHQIDPLLMQQVGESFAGTFGSQPITKVVTLESSGIAPAIMTGLYLQVPVVFARKNSSLTMSDNAYSASAYSYTKETTNDISIASGYLSADDHVLIVDDILANGQAVLGMVSPIEQAGAVLEGIGIVLEKGFQEGGKILRQRNIKADSLAIIDSLANGTVYFRNQEVSSE